MLWMVAALGLLPHLLMSQEQTKPCTADAGVVTATRVAHEIALDAQHRAAAWDAAAPVLFCQDWQGKNPDTGRQTEVRLLWTPQTLYLRFECRYRELFLFDDSDANGRRDHLWDRDVAEAFLQPDPSRPRRYKEFEVSPNGMWIDLDISLDAAPDIGRDLKSGLARSVWLDKAKHVWSAEVAIPMKALTADFDSKAVWRANFFRVEGTLEPRFYSAWRATGTPQPSFHVPSAFGELRFVER
jgi:Carbohydrate family 9 binding domain-like